VYLDIYAQSFLFHKVKLTEAKYFLLFA
jgi:hypothetical protein